MTGLARARIPPLKKCAKSGSLDWPNAWAGKPERPSAERGLLVPSPTNQAQIVGISDAPFARPDFRRLIQGIKFVAQNHQSARGTP